jgi:hypothetical protein
MIQPIIATAMTHSKTQSVGCRATAQLRPLTGRFFGRRPIVPVGAGVVMGRVGTLVDVVSPGDRAPFVLPSTETRATTRDVVSPGDRAPLHSPTSPAPTGTKPLPRHVCKKPTRENQLRLLAISRTSIRGERHECVINSAMNSIVGYGPKR